jgi:FkbM family methyltransferase
MAWSNLAGVFRRIVGRTALPADQLLRMIRASGPERFFRCRFNGEVLDIPRDTLRSVRGSVRPSPPDLIEVWIEIDHMVWMKERLAPGDVFLDVGAATGAIALPLARSHGDVRVVAFEPAHAARALLTATLARNGINNVEVLPFAVSSAPGKAQFAEFKLDDDDVCPFRTETSAILSRMIDTSIADLAEVEVTTLDAFTAARPDADRMRVMKIDVEGFEARVLEGAVGYLGRVRPHISIDIHTDPFGEGTTEASVRARLDPFGYEFKKVNHVLLCTPVKA